jgi:hypothetical protein
VRVAELRRLVEVSGELSDVLLAAFDARRRLVKRTGQGGLVLAGDDDRDPPLPHSAALGHVGLVRTGENHRAA